MKRLDKLQETLKGLKFNINKFCDCGLKTITTLMDDVGDSSQLFEKIYEALKSTPNNEFSNILVIWQSVLDQISTHLEIVELLVKARAEYLGMVTLTNWSTSGSTNNQSIPKKSKQNRDIAALLASSEEANAKINAMTKALAKASKKGYPAIMGNRDKKKSGPKHDLDIQFGEERDLSDKKWFHDVAS